MKNKKIKVMYLINSFSLAGAEKLVYGIAKRMDKNKFDVFVCAIGEGVDGMGSEIRKDLESYRVKTLSIEKIAHKQKLNTILKLVHILHSNRIHILHTNCPSPDFYGKVAGFLASTPYIFTTIHNTEGYNPLKEKFLSLLTTKYIAISESVKAYAVNKLKIPLDRIEVIYNGVDLEDFFNVSVERNSKLKELMNRGSCKVITSVGRVSKQKGYIYLVEAAKVVLQKFPDTYFYIAGSTNLDVDLVKKLNEKLKDYGIESHFVFGGVRKDIPEVLAVSDVFVLPSLWEGFPTVLIEAMASGTPVVTTDVGSNKEIIIDGKNGFIVPPKDANALAERIISLLSNQKLSKRMGELGRETVKKFSISNTKDKYEELYLSYFRNIK